MNRVCNPCRVVAQAPASGCGEYRKDYGSLEVFPLTAVLCDFALERSPGPFPPLRQSSVLFPSICSPLSSTIFPLPLTAPILPFISATAHLHCFHLLRWPGLVLLFWFIIGLFISLLVTHTIYLTFLTPVSARKPFIFHFTWIPLSPSDGSLAHNYSFPFAILPVPTHHPFPFSLDLRGAETKAQARQNVYLCSWTVSETRTC